MPVPKRAEVLVRIDAVAICATDLEVIEYGPPALIQGGLPFNKNWTPGHEYMGTVAALGPGVDEFAIGERVTVEIHAGCGQCKRCRMGMYTSCLNYGLNYGEVDKGHRANGFTTDGGFAEYAVNNINTLIHIADTMTDEEATLVVTAGTAMYGLTELGGLVAGESVVVIGPGPDRPARRGRGQGARRLSGDPDRHARRAPAERPGARRRPRHQRDQGGCGRGGAAAERRQGRRLRDRMLGRAGRHQRGGAHAQPRRQDLPRRLPARAGAGRRGPPGAQQHLRLRHPRRGQSATHRAEAFMRPEALRRHQDPHAHLPAGRSCPRRSATRATASRTPSRWW